MFNLTVIRVFATEFSICVFYSQWELTEQGV